MDDLYTENFDDNEIYFAKPDGLEPLRSLFDTLEKAMLEESIRGKDGAEGI